MMLNSMADFFGGCVEPGGLNFDRGSNAVQCPACTKLANQVYWQASEAGSLNMYGYLRCDYCDFFEGDDPQNLY